MNNRSPEMRPLEEIIATNEAAACGAIIPSTKELRRHAEYLRRQIGQIRDEILALEIMADRNVKLARRLP